MTVIIIIIAITVAVVIIVIPDIIRHERPVDLAPSHGFTQTHTHTLTAP